MALIRRRLLQAAGLLAAGTVGLRLALPRWLTVPEPRPLLPEEADFVAGCFEGLDRARMWDMHVHLFGLGEDGSGCWVNPHARSALSLVERTRFEVFMAASGVQEGAQLEQQYVDRLLRLHQLANPEGRLVVLAFDAYVNEAGKAVPRQTQFIIPDSHALGLAARHEVLEAGISVHPYREDAVLRLEEGAAAGARLVKWLPSAMNIDPASERCDPFYERLAQLDMPLLVHAGSEWAVPGDQQVLGNPLRLRRALEHGVKVVVAHGASLGQDWDIDAPAGLQRPEASWRLLLRMMEEPAWERQLFADISAITQVNRCGAPLRALLGATHLHHRLVNGSDYPLPAIDPLFSTWQLEREGYLDARQRRLCNSVFEANPLLFDFVLKRSVMVREGGRALGFAPNVFETEWLFT